MRILSTLISLTMLLSLSVPVPAIAEGEVLGLPAALASGPHQCLRHLPLAAGGEAREADNVIGGSGQNLVPAHLPGERQVTRVVRLASRPRPSPCV